MSTTTQRKGGRRTRDQEIDLYLRGIGVDRAALEATGRALAIERARSEDPDRPRTYKEMAERALESLVGDYEQLTGVAKVQAYKAIQQLAREEGDAGPGVEEVEPPLAEILEGIVHLTPQRRTEILRRELEKITAEREQILEALS